MRREEKRFAAAGLQIVLIGLGSAEEAAAFRAAMRLPFPILADPERRAYRAYGLARRGRRGSLAKELSRLLPHLLRHGGALSPTQDMLQLGGTFVVGQDGHIRFAQHAAHTADHPAIEDLLRAATQG